MSIRSPVASITPDISLALILLILQGVVPRWETAGRQYLMLTLEDPEYVD